MRPNGRRQIYLSESPEFSDGYGRYSWETFVNARRPWDYQNPEHLEALRQSLEADPNFIYGGGVGATDKASPVYHERLQKLRDDGKTHAASVDSAMRDAARGDWLAIDRYPIWEHLQRMLDRGDHDGVWITEAGARNLIVPDARQVKSATHNEGTFDPTNPDTRFSVRGERPSDEAIIGAAHLARGNKRFSEWSRRMVDDLGEEIRPQLSRLWQESRQYHAESRRALDPAAPTPEARRLERVKSALLDRTELTRARTEGGDLAPAPRAAPVSLDEEGTRLKAEFQRAKDDFDMAVERNRLKQRTPLQRLADTFVKVERAMKLTGSATLAKLSGAALARVGITPAEEAIGGIYSKLPVLRRVAAAAPREGGLDLHAEMEALGRRGFFKGVRQIPSVLKTGRSQLDVLHGKRQLTPHSLLDLPGAIHGAIKNPVKYAEFARATAKRTAFYERAGMDVDNTLVQARIASESYQDAQRAIFMQENPINTAFRGFVRQLQTSKTHPNLGFYSAKGLEFLLPIVKVPTNVIGEGITYTGGLASGTVRLANAMRKGLDTLKPEQADLIMRELKKGSLGAGLLALGFLGYQSIGGLHQDGEKRDKDDLKPGDIRVFGVTIPKKWLHAPAFETLNVGATIRRVAETYDRRTGDLRGISAGALAGLLGIIKEVPFVSTAARVDKLLTAGPGGDYERGSMARSTLVPLGVQDVAKFMDKRNPDTGEPIKRTPRTLAEHVEMGVPGLRERVPYATRNEDDRNAALRVMTREEVQAFDRSELDRKMREQKLRKMKKALEEDKRRRASLGR